jgi:hypothetical protein
MQKSKIVNVLKTFSEDEMKRFSDFISSPYFNSNQSPVRLFNALKKYYPDFDSSGVTKETLYKKLFEGEKYNDQVMRNLSSQLLKLSKEFLSYEAYKNEPDTKELNLLNELKNRSIDSIFNSDFKAFKGKLEKEKIDFSLFQKLAKLEEIYTSFHLQRDKQSHIYESLSRTGEYLLFYSLIRLSDIYINLRINQDALNADIGNDIVIEYIRNLDLKKLINFIEDKDYKNSGVIKLFYSRMLAVLNPGDNEKYIQFKNLLFSSVDKLTFYEAQQLLGSLEFIATYRINRGERGFYKDLFELYEFQLKNNFYMEHTKKRVRVLNFRNTVLVAVRVGEIDWAENYVKKFKNFLYEENKEMADYALGLIHFERGEFEKTIQSLQHVKTDYSQLKVDIKYLLVKAFFEVGYDESVISQLNSFRHLVTTHKQITDITREKGTNFINLMNLLLKAKYEPDKERILEIKHKLSALNFTADKLWIEKKLLDIENKKTAV